MRALREIVRLDQHDRESLGGLFEALVAARAWADIRALREHATNLDPNSLGVHLALAHALYETGDRDGAVFEYESAAALDPPNADAIRERVAAVRRNQRGLAPIAAPREREGRGERQGSSDAGVSRR